MFDNFSSTTGYHQIQKNIITTVHCSIFVLQMCFEQLYWPQKFQLFTPEPLQLVLQLEHVLRGAGSPLRGGGGGGGVGGGGGPVVAVKGLHVFNTNANCNYFEESECRLLSRLKIIHDILEESWLKMVCIFFLAFHRWKTPRSGRYF